MRSIFLIVTLLFGTLSIYAQTIMNIHQNNGTILQIPTSTIDSITYTIPNQGVLAELTTSPIQNISNLSASSGGTITSSGGSPLIQRGVVWSTNPNPTLNNDFTVDGSGIGSFSSELSNLQEGTTYYVRAYAINSAGTAYGDELNFSTTPINEGIISYEGAGVELDGYLYPTVILGNNQEWMAENLQTSIYSNGDEIANSTSDWSPVTTYGVWANINNVSQTLYPYGKYYNWYTVVDPRNVCPSGWHVPSNEDWNNLLNYLDPTTPGFPVEGQQSSTAGGMMKTVGEQYWLSPNGGATNESGFNGIPAGAKILGSSFLGVGANAFWWSANEYDNDNTYGWFISLNYSDTSIGISGFKKYQGVPIRCIKD